MGPGQPEHGNIRPAGARARASMAWGTRQRQGRVGRGVDLRRRSGGEPEPSTSPSARRAHVPEPTLAWSTRPRQEPAEGLCTGREPEEDRSLADVEDRLGRGAEESAPRPEPEEQARWRTGGPVSPCRLEEHSDSWEIEETQTRRVERSTAFESCRWKGLNNLAIPTIRGSLTEVEHLVVNQIYTFLCHQ